MTIKNDALRFQARLLFFITPTAWKRDASFGVNDAKPGETLFIRR